MCNKLMADLRGIDSILMIAIGEPATRCEWCGTLIAQDEEIEGDDLAPDLRTPNRCPACEASMIAPDCDQCRCQFCYEDMADEPQSHIECAWQCGHEAAAMKAVDDLQGHRPDHLVGAARQLMLLHFEQLERRHAEPDPEPEAEDRFYIHGDRVIHLSPDEDECFGPDRWEIEEGDR